MPESMTVGGCIQKIERDTAIADPMHRNIPSKQRIEQGKPWGARCGIGEKGNIVDPAALTIVEIDAFQCAILLECRRPDRLTRACV